MKYYNDTELQPVHAADAWNLDRYLFTAVAYLARAGKKDGSSYEDDVLKALWFLAYAVTKNADHAAYVRGVCKNLAQEVTDEDQETEGHQLPVYVRTTNDTGNVDDYTVDGRQEESKLVREKCNNTLRGVSDEPEDPSFPERVSQWLKGAIE